MNSTLYTPEEIKELNKLLTDAKDSILYNDHAKKKIEQSLKIINKWKLENN